MIDFSEFDAGVDTSASRLEQIKKDINLQDLLNKYGPEGLYVMAQELMRIADQDVNEAYKQSFKI